MQNFLVIFKDGTNGIISHVQCFEKSAESGKRASILPLKGSEMAPFYALKPKKICPGPDISNFPQF